MNKVVAYTDASFIPKKAAGWAVYIICGTTKKLYSGICPPQVSCIQHAELFSITKALSYAKFVFPNISYLQVETDNLHISQMLAKNFKRKRHLMLYDAYIRELRTWLVDTAGKNKIYINSSHVPSHQYSKNMAAIINNIVDRACRGHLKFKISEDAIKQSGDLKDLI
jgi:ribonuclease HI